MAARKRYVVTAPLVVITDTTGAQQYAYQGREILFDTDSAKLDELVAMGMVALVPASEDDPASLVPTEFTEPPAKSASLETWRAFAASELGGMPANEAASAKKKDLVEKYLGGNADTSTDE